MILLKIYSLLLSIIILSLFFTSIMSSEGIFQIHIKRYFLQKSLKLEKCCPKSEPQSMNCASHCNIFMEICLSVYQKVPHRYACDIGENMIVTDALGNDKMSANGDKDYSIKVRERWSKNFNILVKIKHKDEQTKKDEVIVTLSSAEENVKPSSDWITKELSSPKDHFQLLVSFRYSCSDYHYGEMCDKYCKPSHSGLGHYNCSATGDIICHNGYTGSYCDKVVCQKKCIHGTCTGPNLCRCFTGWIGDSCEKCLPYPGCVNGGCRKDVKGNDSLPLTCDCHTGWGGMFCNIDLNYCSNNPNVCLNGGECQNFGNINTNQQYRCLCKPGFQGTHCEKSVTNCLVRGCFNDGLCVKNGRGNMSTCTCKQSFYGDQCQFNMTSCAEGPCIGSNSKCYPDSKLGFQCDCAAGFIGRNCEIDKDECLTNPCLNGGLCIDRPSGFRCVCPVGFSGNRCQVNKNDCQRLSCMNGARCMDKANRIDCLCSPGWTGPICNQNIDECATNQPCMNGGQCQDTAGSYTCSCVPPWGGPMCNMMVLTNRTGPTDRRCLINPCRNNGLCYLTSTKEEGVHVEPESVRSIGGRYYCLCPPGFKGPLCNHVMITNDTVTVLESHLLSTISVVSFTDRHHKSPVTLINLIIIAIGVPTIIIILIVFSCLWYKTAKSSNGKSQPMKYQNSLNKGSHHLANNAHIKILNNKLNGSGRTGLSSYKLPLVVSSKQNNCLTKIPLPPLSLATYKCSMVPLVVDKHKRSVSVSQNPNLFSVDVGEEDDHYGKKSDRDGEPESAMYQNISPTKEVSKSDFKTSFDSNFDYSNECGYKPMSASNSVMLKRKKERPTLHGLCSSQNSLLDSPRNQNLRAAISQQFHRQSPQCCDETYCDKLELQNLHQVPHRTLGTEWPLAVNYQCSNQPATTSGTDPQSNHRYVLYYTRSKIPPKINYSLISHPNFRETSCFLDSSIYYPSLKSVRTDSTSIDCHGSQNM